MITRRAPQHTVQSRWQERWIAIRRTPRVVLLGLLILVIFGVFGQRLWHLQVVRGTYYSTQADQQRLRSIAIPAARGIVYARDGTPLVRNVPTFKISVIPEYLPDYDVAIIPAASPDAAREIEVTFSPDTEAVLIRLAVLLDMSYTAAGNVGSEGEAPLGVKEIIEHAIEEGAYYQPVMIKKNVGRDTALLVASERLTLPGVLVEVEATRSYPYGPLTSHLVGYLQPIPSESKEVYEARGYNPASDRIGVAGIEAIFEDALRGEKGSQLVEADVLGRVIRVVEERAVPSPGGNVYLTVDLDLQRSVEEALRRGMARAHNSPRGVAIVMNPRTGEVLAMVSLPTYDDNLFAQGISTSDWRRLNEDVHRPLMNHAVSDRLPPGSVFKIVVATAALREGVLTPKTKLHCPGTIVVPNKYFPNDPGRDQPFHCWFRAGHGTLDIVGGLAHSCDIFFYKVGGGFEEDGFEGLGVDRIAEYARMFGFGTCTGVELTAEIGGTVPTATWKRLAVGENWSTGDTYNLAIGQGYLEVTPLQMLNAVNVVANGGTLYRPSVVHHVTDANGNVTQPFEPDVISATLPISPEIWSLIQQGMELAVVDGTATDSFPPIESVRVAGKTGTAQFCDDIMCGAGYAQPEHAWFAAFAPVGNPEVSVIAFLYNGGEGSEYAVPVVYDILRYYFDRDEASSE